MLIETLRAMNVTYPCGPLQKPALACAPTSAQHNAPTLGSAIELLAMFLAFYPVCALSEIPRQAERTAGNLVPLPGSGGRTVHLS
jgi:hypothetical protein